jgi:opacity protein-like surface antigen
MSRVTLVATALLTLLISWAPASAQSWEVSGLAAYTPSAGIEHQAPELKGLDIGGGFTYGIQAGRLLTPRWGAEVLWTRQSSALKLGTAAGTAELFTMTVRQLHGDVVYHLGAPDARLRPFVFGGLGATIFSADELKSETKFSFGLGAGVKYFRWNALGLRAHFRYKPTMMSDEDAADFCDPFGFCQGTLQQIEFMGGAVLRF